MSISLSASYTAITTGITSSFLATGGTGPYTYSLIPNGIGGQINSSTGVYYPPQSFGIDTVLAKDTLGATTTIEILVGSPLDLVCDIIETYMGLSQGQVWLFDQKVNIPPDNRLYVAVGISSCKPFGNSNTASTTGTQQQSINMLARLDINILSRSTVALYQKEQILLALNSTYAEQQMEANSFFIAPISTGFVNLSNIDGAAIPYRFVITVQCQYFVGQTSSIPYYSTFAPVQITTNP